MADDKIKSIALKHGGPSHLIAGIRGMGSWGFKPGQPVPLPADVADQLLAKYDGTDPQYGAMLYCTDDDTGGDAKPPQYEPGHDVLSSPHPKGKAPVPASPASVIKDKAKGSAVTMADIGNDGTTKG